MKKNVGNPDKIIRIVLAIVFIALYFTNTVTGTWGIVLLVAAAILIFTSFMNSCPLYSIFGFSSCPLKSGSSE
jgi:hypothetical protein